MRLREMLATQTDDFRSCITEYPDEDRSSVRVYAITHKNETVGYIAYDRWDTKSACICFLHVKPIYRCKGFGSKAVRKMIELLSPTCDYIYGFAEPHVIPWYIKQGFNVYDGEVIFHVNSPSHKAI